MNPERFAIIYQGMLREEADSWAAEAQPMI